MIASMTLRQFVIAGLLLLTACASPAEPPLAASVELLAPDRLILRVSAGQALEQAELTAPDGRAFQAQRLVVREPPEAERPSETGRDGRRPGVILGGSGGSSSGLDAGIGLSLPLKNPFAAERKRPIAAQAEFRLPPELLERYRANPKAWLVYLTFGNATRSIPGPNPEY